eukprot:5875262-Prymnesium_polylepis.1
MLRRVLCGHGVVDVGRAVGVLFNRNRSRHEQGRPGHGPGCVRATVGPRTPSDAHTAHAIFLSFCRSAFSAAAT